MPEKNLQKIPSPKSIWQTLGNIRDWFTKSSKGKFMSLNHLIYQKNGQFIEELTLVAQILRLASGLLLIMTTTGLLFPNTIQLIKPLIIMLALLTLIDILLRFRRLMVTHQVHNGSASSHKEADRKSTRLNS